MRKKIELLMTKKELEIVKSGSLKSIKLLSRPRLKRYITLTRKLRDKYRDLAQRQKVANGQSQNVRTLEKAEVFKKVLSKYEKQIQSSGPLLGD
jgi:hypothetical protein